MHPGGMGHYTAMLANAISKRADVTIIGQEGVNLDYINKNITIKNVLKYPIGFSLKNALSFKNIFLVNTIRPDIIHITFSYPIFIFFGRFFISGKIPLVVTVHDPKPHSGELKNNWRSIFEDFFYILLIKKANRLIVHSEKQKNELIERKIHPDKIAVIPHGDYNFFTSYSRGNQVEKNCILFFGRIIEYKGLEYLIKAIPLISKEIPTIKVIIAGKGNFEKYQKLIDTISNDYFEVHNHFITDDQVPEFFERAELLILPYIEATQSGPLHIAYAFKKPVVATNVGALPEVISHGKTGLIVPPKDIASLAEAIIKLLKDDTLRKEMGENAYRKMKEQMSWDNIADKTIEVYNEAIQEFKNKK
jgi:glycosyltransferase involved in cell wall biosynthesis